jgi:putative tricarboxylic transport membrane protein
MSQKTRHNARDLISGFFFLGLGLSLCILAVTKFSVWTNSEPQEGFFPLVMGIIMAGLGITVAVRSYWGEIRERGEVLKKGNAATSRLLGYLTLIGLYVIFFESLGFIISSTLFLASVLKVLERKSWKITLLVTVGAVAVSYFLFRFFLSVPLPRGLM